MSANLGSWKLAGNVAAGALADLGYSRLAMLYGKIVATYGTACVLTDVKLRLMDEMRRPDGRPYHVGSLGRIRRMMADDGVLESQRVFVGGKLPMGNKRTGKPWTTSRGTTIKRFIWSAVNEKNPFNRRERRLLRQVQAKQLREAGDIVRASDVVVRATKPGEHKSEGPRIALPLVHEYKRAHPLERLDPDLARTINAARHATEARDVARTRSEQRLPPPERPPPE